MYNAPHFILWLHIPIYLSYTLLAVPIYWLLWLPIHPMADPGSDFAANPCYALGKKLREKVEDASYMVSPIYIH